MSRCRESAGVLFKRRCPNEADRACGRCGKPICFSCAREVAGGQFYCLSCMREGLRDQRARGSFAHLRDDPYFFWYYHHDGWFADPFVADDFMLFDTASGDFDTSAEVGWEGS